MAGRSGQRITMTIPYKRYETLQICAQAMDMTAGDVAKEIVFEALDELAEMIQIAQIPEISPEVAIRKLYKKALISMADTIDDN